jgi:hypothetical protein
MDAMNSPSKLFSLLQQIRTDYPVITFTLSDRFRWDPNVNTIFYTKLQKKEDAFSLLHELGHMESGHNDYKKDFELLLMETAAWNKAQKLGQHYDFPIDQDYIDDCLDSYRDWLHKRSRCPKCSQTGIEQKPKEYRCINCQNTWEVSASRFCRVYRKSKSTTR